MGFNNLHGQHTYDHLAAADSQFSHLIRATPSCKPAQFDFAIRTAEKALDIARGGGETNLAVMTESRLKLYQAGKPYREGTN